MDLHKWMLPPVYAGGTFAVYLAHTLRTRLCKISGSKRSFIEVLSCCKSCQPWFKFYCRILLNVETYTAISEWKMVGFRSISVYN